MVNNMMLQIVKGLPGVPGDTLTVEHIDEVIDLLGSRNWSVDNRGWVPQMPQVKDGGVYVDNPVIAGKFPVVMTLGDVQETITLVNRGASVASRSWIEQKLFRLARDAEDFWITDTQNQPVYLVFQPSNGVGPQYARIYTMDIAPQMDVMERQNYGKVTITIDREHGWTPIPPGENPKRWGYIAAGTEAASWNTGNAVLTGGSGHIASGTIYNKEEFNTLYTFNKVNYIDIPAASIPGDLPAKALITVKPNGFSFSPIVYIGKSSKRTPITNRSSNSLPHFNTLPFAGATMQHADATLNATGAADIGIAHTPASASAKFLDVNFTATSTERYCANWAIGGTGMPHLNPYLLRGTYAIFVRAGYSTATPNVTMRLEIFTKDTNASFFNSGDVPAAAGNTTALPLTYMGLITLPPLPGMGVSSAGTGLQVEPQLDFRFYATRTSATANHLYGTDIILMPIDEAMNIVSTVTTAGGDTAYVDNTGYFLHGKSDYIAVMAHPTTGIDSFIDTELKGGEITLTPNVSNRLYFVWIDTNYGANSKASEQMDITVNIVPRWAGIRDV